METWRPVPGFSGYLVSDLGRVKSTLSGSRILSTPPNGNGYPHLTLIDDSGISRSVKVHRLVLLAFVGPADGRQCRHLNGMRSDNRLANLAWGSAAENEADKVRHGKSKANRTSCPRGHSLTDRRNLRAVGNESPRRRCLSCARALQAARRGCIDSSELKEFADHIYRRLTEGEAA